jgi:hypothetical protein
MDILAVGSEEIPTTFEYTEDGIRAHNFPRLADNHPQDI